MSTKPCESPHVAEHQSKAGQRWAGWPWRDSIVILLAACCFLVLGPVAAALLSHFGVGGPGVWHGETGIQAMIWCHWAGKIVGRLCCDFAAGVLLGRYLRRVNPIHVVAAFMALPIGNLILNPAVHESWSLPIRHVGLGGAALQLVVQLASMFLVLLLGTRLGRRTVNSQKFPTTPEP
jgi:hypothetical protein